MAITRFRYTVSQPADGASFMVPFASVSPAQPAQPDGSYGVWPVIVSGQNLSAPACPDETPGVDRTTTAFRVDTGIALPNGTVIEFTLARNA